MERGGKGKGGRKSVKGKGEAEGSEWKGGEERKKMEACVYVLQNQWKSGERTQRLDQTHRTKQHETKQLMQEP